MARGTKMADVLLDLATMPAGTFAFSKKHNAMVYKLPKNAELLEGSPQVFGSYPEPEPYTVMFAYIFKEKH